MKKILFLILGCLVLAGSAFGSATTCLTPTAPYTAYLVMGFTCTSGNLTFSAFGYSASGNPSNLAVPATAITVTPQTMTNNEGFQFQAGWSVGSQGTSPNTEDSLITFTVTGYITDLHLSFNGSFTGTGRTNVTENYCLNGSGSIANCSGPGQSSGQIQVTNPGNNFNAAVFFAPVTSIAVSKDILVDSGSNGTAAISFVINTFSSPEPLSFVLLGSGLLGLGLLRKRLHKS
jgi:hypothetical protein